MKVMLKKCMEVHIESFTINDFFVTIWREPKRSARQTLLMFWEKKTFLTTIYRMSYN